MPATLLALQIFLILLPGFTAAYIVQALSTRRSQSDLERVIEAIVFSFVIYVLFVFINKSHLPFQIQGATVHWEPRSLASLVGITAMFAFAAVAYVRFDGNRIFRTLRLTERTTRNAIWNDIFEHEALPIQPVQVELSDGRNLIGVLLYYSDDSDENSMYLTRASWVDSDGQTISIPGPGVLLTKNCGIRTVSLLSPLPPDEE